MNAFARLTGLEQRTVRVVFAGRLAAPLAAYFAERTIRALGAFDAGLFDAERLGAEAVLIAVALGRDDAARVFDSSGSETSSLR